METSIINGVKELFELSLQIPGAKFYHHSDVKCVSVYDFNKAIIRDYAYIFESYYGVNPQTLQKAINECREYVNQIKK